MDFGDGRKEYRYNADTFGKYVFLTKEEADMAIAREKAEIAYEESEM